MDPRVHETSGDGSSSVAGPDLLSTTATEEPANTLAPHSVALGLTRAYAPSWRVPDALRELYQNWKDAILETHQISLLEFAPSVSTTPDEITITVEKASAPAANGDAEPPKLLGYICFNRHRGSAEFTNFGSSLDYSCLEMGHTTKTMDDRLAGGHGEGLKIAALVLCREGHQVRIAANGCYWHFGFNGRSKANFFCRLTPFRARQGPGTTNKQRAPPRLSARIWEDVSITIRGLPLQEADFEAWRRDTIDLGPIDPWIRTASGDLLLAPCYRDRLYLKGIHVPETGFDRSAFHFGYNLISGSVGRDRQRLLNASQVTDRIHAIWEEAITQDEAKLLPRYLELLRTHPSAADVCDADRVVTEAVATKLWAALHSEATAANQFYCPKSRCNQDGPIIQSELRKRPTALPDLLWNILRKYDLVREPLEELHSRFRHSQEVDLPDTTFGQGVARTLRALLMLHPSTAGIRVVFVRCDAHTVDLAYQAEEDVLYVHEKWLHTPAPDPPAPPASIECTTTVDVFACQHVVEELYRRALTMVFGQPDGMRSGPSIWQLLQIAQQKLRQMACIVQVSQTDVARTLKVSFYTGHSLAYVDFHGAQSRYLVILHAAECLSAKDNLVYSGSDDVCDCPRQRVSLLSRTVVFGDLGPGPWIPAVAKMCDSSIPLEEQPAHPSLKAQDGALIGMPAPATTPSGCDAAPVTGEDGSTTLGCEITVTDPMGEVDPVAAVAVAPALSPPPAQIENNHGASEEEDTLSEVETIAVSDTDLFLEEIAQDITVVKSNDIGDGVEAENHGADWVFIGPRPSNASGPTTTESRGLDPGSRLTGNVMVTCHSQAKDENEETARCSADQADGDVGSPPSSAPERTLDLPKKETAWWTAWPIPHHRVHSRNITNETCRKLLDDSHTLCNQYQQFTKGKYVQVMIGPDASSGGIGRCILYVHGVLLPVQGIPSSPKVIATRYTFLVDHPVLGRRASDGSDRELLVHFRDIDHIAKESDAEILDTRVMVVTDAGELVPQSFVTSIPDPSTGFSARMGVWEGSSETTLFATPLAVSSKEQRPSCFSPLPAAAVLDLSPGDTILSAGFAHAGYRIHAAVGFDAQRHQSWKVQHTDAAVYPGDAVSVMANPESAAAVLSGLRESHTPRIVTISAGGPLVDPIMNQGPLDACKLCRVVAQSSIIQADFIVLILPRSALGTPGSLGSSLAHTVEVLLEAGYCVTLRAMSQDSGLLLAAPGETKPQWIDDTLSELQGLTQPLELESSKSGDGPHQLGRPRHRPLVTITSPSGESSKESDSTSAEPIALENEQSRGLVSVRTARNIAISVARVIGEFSKQNHSGARVTESAGERIKRQKM